jgi:hypothetical protein
LPKSGEKGLKDKNEKSRAWAQLLLISTGNFPGRHIVAQAFIEHSNIAQSEHDHFTTEK